MHIIKDIPIIISNIMGIISIRWFTTYPEVTNDDVSHELKLHISNSEINSVFIVLYFIIKKLHNLYFLYWSSNLPARPSP